MKLLYFINVDWYFCLHWLDRAKAARNAGYEVHVVTHFTSQSSREMLETHGLNYHDISLDRRSMNPLSVYRSYRETREILEALKPDILHCITVKPNLIGGFIAKQMRLHCVLSVTGRGLAFSSQKLKPRISKAIIVACYRRVIRGNHVKVLFEHEDDCHLFTSLKLGSPDTNLVIPGAGVDVDRYAYSTPQQNSNGITVLFAARMLWDKGIADLIEACRLVNSRGQRVYLKVAGLLDNDTQAAIPEDRILEWHSAGDIEWLGPVEDMPDLIKKADVVALPTIYGEGIPRILMEAASCGRACIATDVSGCREIVIDGENGFLVPKNDPKAIAERLEIFLENYDLVVSMGRAGRKLVESRFEQSIIVDKLFDIYDALIAT